MNGKCLVTNVQLEEIRFLKNNAFKMLDFQSWLIRNTFLLKLYFQYYEFPSSDKI